LKDTLQTSMTGYALITVIQSETGHLRAGYRRTAALFPAGTAGMSQGQVAAANFPSNRSRRLKFANF